MIAAFRIWLLLSLLVYAYAVRLLYFFNEDALWLLLLPCLPLLDVLVNRLRRRKGPSGSMRLILRTFFWFRYALRKYLRIHIAHRRRGRQPAGFCPYCSYPMDPGRCPECGVHVTTENLARQPKQSQAGTLRTVIILTSIAVLLVGGYFAYEYTPWAKKLSISTLLRLHDWGEPLAMAEIVHRVNSGTLKDKEEKEICDRTLKLNIATNGPYTRDGMIGAALVAESKLPILFSRMWIYVRDVEVFVDGESQGIKLKTGAIVVGDDRVKFVSEKVGAGSHTIRVRGHMAVAPAYVGDPDASALVSGPFDSTTTIEVENRDSTSVFEAVTGKNVEDDIKNNITMKYVRTPPPNSTKPIPVLIVSNRSLRALPIAGRVMVRPAGKGDYQLATTLICNPGETDPIPLDKVPGVGRSRSIDVRIEPDPVMMPFFRREGQMKYIGEVIERKKLRRDSSFFGF